MKVIQCAGKCRPLPSRVAAQRYEGEDMKVGYVNQTFIGAAIMHICPKKFQFNGRRYRYPIRIEINYSNRAAAGKFTVSRPRE